MGKRTRLLCMLLAALLLLWAFPAAAYAEGDPAKTVTVGAEETCTTIQAAIDHIAAQEDKTGWTIVVKEGAYARFTVPSGLNGLTIEGESQSGVVIETLQDTARSDQWDNGGVNVHSGSVTLRNLTVRAGSSTASWCDAAISTHHGAYGGSGVSLTVENCTVTGENAKYGIFWDCERVEVKNCTISGFSNAIEIMGDNYSIPAGQTYRLTGNTITGCSFAIHGYLGGGSGGGVLEISGNTVRGTEALRAKVIAQQNAPGTMKVDIRDNRFENVVIGLVNLSGEGETVSAPLTANTLGKNCFYVEAIEPGTIEFYSTYHAPGGDNGYWALTGIDDFDVDWGKNPDGSTAFIQDVIDKANAEGSHTLSLTGIDENNLIKTFTWFKDGIYWVSVEATPTPVPTNPGPTYYPDYTEQPAPTPTACLPEETPVQEDCTSPKTGEGGAPAAAVFALALCTAFVFGRRAVRSR